ncbi:hypothetical protein FRC00_006146 [Tulasnella sp. 408]|nr:hypothetical protein FRC00_006146 [Tulasnella sp. 408]
MLNPNPSFTSFAPTLTPDNASILTATIPFDEGKRNNKRKNALLELLSSERAYAADLALVRDIHIPLSKGLPTPFDPSSQGSLPSIPSQSQNQISPRSSTHTASSAQTHSSVSTALTSVSAGSTGGVSPADLPMPPETSKVVFGNIDEIAVFADRFSEELETALGDIIPGGTGQDRVGKLFLEMIPLMGPLYKTYITKHPTANTQFQSLPPSPALTQYNAQCRQLVAAHSNAWDVPSFLIKPVQRLLKYPLLLGSIYNETPDSHPDKQNLIDAKVKIEEVARMVNEGRRRWEVVKTVLNGNNKANSAANGAGAIAARSGAPKMTRMRSFRTKIKPNGETIDVERDRIELEAWEKRIKESESVVKDVAKQTLEWNQSLETVLKRLKNWNAGFGRVTGLGEAGVEAVGAFGKVVQGLQLLSYEFNKTVQTVYLPQLSLLLRTLSSPRILLAHMHTLRHSHVALLNTPYKTRPPSSLVEASNDYRALRDTLQEELPTFMRLFEKGLAVLLLEFAEWQMRLWREVKERWTSFWIALAIEGEGDENVAGIGSNAAETIKIWKERFCEVEEVLVGFRTLTRPPKSQGTSRPSTSGSIYRQPNGSEASMDPYGRALYQQGSRSLSAHDLLNNPITEEAVTWEVLERELAHRSISSTPSVHSHHRRGNSAQAESQLAHLMANPMIPGPAFIPSSKDKKKPRDSREPPRSSNSNNRDSREPPRSSNSSSRDLREQPRASTSSNRDMRDTRGRPEVPVPKVVEPYTQDRGMALARATSPKPTNPPVSPRDKKKAKDKEKHRSRELDDSASIRGRGDASSLRATSPRPFRRKLTDTLFGSPRSPSHSRTRSQQSNTLSEPDPDFKASRRSSNTSSLEPPSAHSRNAFSPLPPLRVSGNSFASEVPVPFQLDPPPSPLYACTTVCPFKHDRSVTYMSLPMLELDIGDTIQVLYEAGHPRDHALPGYVDEGDDCLLAAREESTGRIGWVLASYVIPIQ